ncbi:MAG: glycosyltransferase family 39 protein, partial [Candidatus Latescibacteria bacterium]|nr:glycosyltransferase family 39 protein [Candidatus Latescibacterota bacterium]
MYTAFFVRLPVIFLSLGVSIAAYITSYDLFGSHERAAATAVLMNIIPVFFIGGIMAITDIPLTFFWILSALFLIRLIKTKNPVYFYLLALSLAGALYSKYTTMFLIFGVVLFFVLSPNRCTWLKNPHLWFSALFAFLLLTPMIWWNYHHDWISYRFLVNRGAIPQSFSLTKLLDYFFSYHGAQFLLLSPLIYIAVILTLLRVAKRWLSERDDGVLACLALSVPALLYFSYLSFRTRTHPNWSLPGYPTAIILMVEDVGSRLGERAKLFIYRPGYVKWAAGTALTLCLLISIHAVVGLTPASMLEKDRLQRELRGWPELGRKISELGKSGQVIMATRYQVASELEFYHPEHPRVYCMNAFGRGNQYDFINDYQALGGKDVLLVTEKGIPGRLAEKFHHVEPPIKFEVVYRGAVLRTFLIYKCAHFDNSRGISLEESKKIM